MFAILTAKTLVRRPGAPVRRENPVTKTAELGDMLSHLCDGSNSHVHPGLCGDSSVEVLSTLLNPNLDLLGETASGEEAGAPQLFAIHRCRHFHLLHMPRAYTMTRLFVTKLRPYILRIRSSVVA